MKPSHWGVWVQGPDGAGTWLRLHMRDPSGRVVSCEVAHLTEESARRVAADGNQRHTECTYEAVPIPRQGDTPS